VEVWEEWKDKGLVILALSDESKSEVEKFIGSFKASYPIGAGSRASDRYGVQGIPAAFLIDHEGTVLWTGHPATSEWVDMLPDALARALDTSDAWNPGDRHAALQRAVEAATAGEMGKAWKESEGLRTKAATDGELAAALDGFQKDFLARAAQRTQRKDHFLSDGRYWEATVFFERQMKVFAGSPPVEEWKALLAGWKSDKTAKANMDLDKRRLAALEKAQAGEKEKAMKELRSLKEKAQGLVVLKAIEATYKKVGNS
jgi:hypothetical protein